ncbi:MAG: helix-turn-helix domain-containing protein [Chlamydiales bacterium]
MSEEMKRVGNLLKTKRRELNLSLKEIENSTSIRSSYLEAIEEGKISQFIAAVYALGFVRQYASFLGLDAERIMLDHPHAFKLPAEKHEFSYGIGTLEVRGSMSGGVKWFPNLMWAAISVAVIVLAWYLAKYLGIF